MSEKCRFCCKSQLPDAPLVSSIAVDVSVIAPVARIAWTTGRRPEGNSSAASINTALPISPA
jgi:hypothetical protein